MANEVDYSPLKYKGNNATRDFSFNWKVLKPEELVVQLENIETSEITQLIMNTDYTVVLHDVGGNVNITTAPTTEYNVVLSRNTSNYQSKSYSTSSGFQGSEIEKSFDRYSLCLQEMNHNIETFEDNLNEEFGVVIQDFKDLQERTDEIYEYADDVLTDARESADLAEQYAESAQFGMKWVAFHVDNWVASGNKYTLTIHDEKVVNDVYKGSWQDKELVKNIDIEINENGVVITSHDAFDGFLLCASSVLGIYTHEQTLASDEWVIDHNLGFYPNIIVVDDNYKVMECTRKYPTLNRVVCTFENQVTGKVFLR
jgi:hypothetical protein